MKTTAAHKAIIAVGLTALALSAGADNLTRRGLRVDQTKITAPAQPLSDTVTVTADSIALSGYDKPLRSTGESFFVTNRMSVAIDGVEVELVYSDLQGRQLHRRRLLIKADIPQGETRRVDIRSWDKRQTLYYHRGPQPRSGVATPFDVRVTPLRVLSRR